MTSLTIKAFFPETKFKTHSFKEHQVELVVDYVFHKAEVVPHEIDDPSTWERIPEYLEFTKVAFKHDFMADHVLVAPKGTNIVDVFKDDKEIIESLMSQVEEEFESIKNDEDDNVDFY